MTEKPRLGIVGFGVQGSVYAELIADRAVTNIDLGAICDGDPAKRQLVESKYAAAFHEDYVTMLDSGNVDAVVLTVPSYLHPQMGIDALQRNGVDYVLFTILGGKEQLRRFAREVMPAFVDSRRAKAPGHSETSPA